MAIFKPWCKDADLIDAPEVRKWVATFEETPIEIFEESLKNEPTAWQEVTPLASGIRVHIKKFPEEFGYGWLIDDECDDNDLYRVKYSVCPIMRMPDKLEQLLNWEQQGIIMLKRDEFEVIHDIPFIYAIWAFTSPEDNKWIATDTALQDMAEWGFRIFKHVERGYFFAPVALHDYDEWSDGLYLDYWEPLYSSRFWSSD